MKIQSAITCYKQRRQLLLTFLTMVTRWSCSEEPPRGSYVIVCKYVCSTSNLYALIGQNLTGEFMRKISTAIWNLFTLATETDRVLCHLVMFLTVFFHWLSKNEMCDSRKYPYPPPPPRDGWSMEIPRGNATYKLQMCSLPNLLWSRAIMALNSLKMIAIF